MKDKSGICKCDYCGIDAGNFYTDTGNHVTCQQLAEKDAELLALRAELADAKARAKTAEENWHKNEARIAKIETTAKELINVLTDGEIEIARESWGNTNTRLVSERRRALVAALKSQ